MTVGSTYAPAKYTGNSSTLDFTYSFPIGVATYLEVYLEVISTGVQTLKTQGSDYTLVFDETGGTVTFASAPTALQYVIISRNVAFEQQVSLTTSKVFDPKIIEGALDKLTEQTQQLKEFDTRVLSLPLGSPITSVSIPTPSAGKAIVWNDTGDGFENSTYNPDEQVTLAAAQAEASAASATTSSTYAANSATSATASATSATASALSASQAASAVTNAAPENFIINSNFDFWDNGTSFSSISTDAQVSNGWLWTASGSVATITRQPFTVGQTEVPNNPNYYLQWQAVSGGTNGSQLRYIRFDGTKFSGKSVVLSFYAKTTDATYPIYSEIAQNFGTGGSTTVETLSSSFYLTTSWAKYSISINVPSISGKTVGSSDALYIMPIRRSNDSDTSTILIANVELIEGSTYIPCRKRPIIEEETLVRTNPLVIASGTDTITSFTDNILAYGGYNNGQRVTFIAAADNTSTTPTFAVNNLGAKTIVKNGGTALAAGDIRANNAYILSYDNTNARWNLLNPKFSGRVVQQVRYETSALASGTTALPCDTTVLPCDNTVPQNTEGDQYMSLAITPTKSTNILVIDSEVTGSLSSGTASAIGGMALFQDSTANALAAVVMPQYYAINGILKHSMTAGTTSATTFKVRCGCSVVGTFYLNGNPGGVRFFGGTAASSMTITEYEV